MDIKPISKLIIIKNTHLKNISEFDSLNSLVKILQKEDFQINQEFSKENIEIYQSDLFKDESRQTHLIINLNNLVSEINYYSLN